MSCYLSSCYLWHWAVLCLIAMTIPQAAPSWKRGSLPLAEPRLSWGVLLQRGLFWGELSRVCFLQVVKMSSSDPDCPQFLFVKVLASRGRLEAVTQQMGYHPQYLDSFLKTQHYLMHMDGPLPFDCRHYIAIMVSPAGSCQRGQGALLSPVRLSSTSNRQPMPWASHQGPKS